MATFAYTILTASTWAGSSEQGGDELLVTPRFRHETGQGREVLACASDAHYGTSCLVAAVPQAYRRRLC